MSDRRALKKVVGKELEFSAVYDKVSKDKKSVMIKEVKIKRKEVADHLWIQNLKSFNRCENGTKIIFTATVQTYRDSKGIRKYGIHKCHNFYFDNGIMGEVNRENFQKYKRLAK